MSKEIPILFSTAMVQAVLEGRKTQTRPIVKGGFDPSNMEFANTVDYTNGKLGIQAYFHEKGDSENNWGIKSKYRPGDVLWVQETFTDLELFKIIDGEYVEDEKGNYIPASPYKADHNKVTWFDENGDEKSPWRSSSKMPKKLARIWLQVESVGVERLKDIKTEDMLAEGIRYNVTEYDGEVHPIFRLGAENRALGFMPLTWQRMDNDKREYHLLFAHWAELWCEINGRESWDANPWVWVVKFKVLSTTGKPDAIPEQ